MSELKQGQKLSQGMVLSKAMYQSINILSMNTIALNEFIQSECQDNPFLEIDDSSKYDTLKSSSNLKTSHSHFDQDEMISKLSDKQITLKEYLISQISLSIFDSEKKNIALYITDSINEQGYLTKSTDDFIKELKVKNKKFNEVLIELKKFEPFGVYSKDLKESLTIQAKIKKIHDVKFQILLDNLDLIGKLNYEELQKRCSVSDEELKILIKKLKSLNPKPGGGFITETTQTLIPEIIICGDKEYGFYPVINDSAIPKCIFQKHNYLEQNKDLEKDKFISNGKKNAMFIIETLYKRKKVLLEVVQKIIELQYEFFLNGVDYLKPMVLTDIANELNINPSTISRISNKYIETLYGIFQIKYFFSSQITSEITEDNFSSTSIKNKIKNIIKSESQNNVFSDEEISKALKGIGISISRRTIAKYRDGLKIPSSAIRKRRQKLSDTWK
ncbi:MAG: RNA polymerase sigma-54 factor [Candidatus Midichloriaceae bacterium]|jgi:RNA polymerase sigma-54 factor